MKFINRRKELTELTEVEALSKKKLFVVAIYGLRRVGKTRLLLEFLRVVGSGRGSGDGSGSGYGRDGLYFFVNKNKTSADLLEEFQGIMKRNGLLGELESLVSWDKFFEVLITREAPPIVFDEFQNFRFVEPSVMGILQKSIDLNEDKPGLIFLSGSLIGLMKKLFKDSKEPLYGRIKKGMKLEPLALESCFEIGELLKLRKEDLMELYFLFGGYPRYYVAVEDFGLEGKKSWDIVKHLFLAKDAPMEDEVGSILSQEFGGRSGTYYSILEAIANGNNTISSIASGMNTPPTSLTRQVKELKDHFEMIELELPFSGRKGVYRIKHPLMEFWFSNIHRNFSEYAERKQEFLDKLKGNLNAFYGKRFEAAARELVVSELGLDMAKRQWGKIAGAAKGENTYEIDILGRKGGEVFAFECKWSDVDYPEAKSILAKLKDKIRHVPRVPGTAHLGIVAKRMTNKQELRADGYYAYDLADFYLGAKK